MATFSYMLPVLPKGEAIQERGFTRFHSGRSLAGKNPPSSPAKGGDNLAEYNPSAPDLSTRRWTSRACL